jgi:hypothetical protein
MTAAINPEMTATGTVRATDGAGNTCEIVVDFTVPDLPADAPQSPPEVEDAGDTTTIQLDSGVPPELVDQFTFMWESDCPGATFDDATSPRPLLTIITTGNDDVECSATVTIGNGLEVVEFSIPIRVRIRAADMDKKFAPVALDQVEVISCDVPYTFSFDCRDLNAGDSLSARVMGTRGNGAGAPFEGQLDVAGMTGTYSPPPGVNGVFFVEYECSDGELGSRRARAALWVLTCEEGSSSESPIRLVGDGCPGNMSVATIAMTGCGVAMLGAVQRRRRRRS